MLYPKQAQRCPRIAAEMSSGTTVGAGTLRSHPCWDKRGKKERRDLLPQDEDGAQGMRGHCSGDAPLRADTRWMGIQ